MKFEQPILVTGADRSGSTLVMRALRTCGADVGDVNRMQENKFLRNLNHSFVRVHSNGVYMPNLNNFDFKSVNWKDKVNAGFHREVGFNNNFAYKDSALSQVWQLWANSYPGAKWIIVRRKTEDIVHSCKETSYMKLFKNAENRRQIGASTEKEGWEWWVKQYQHKFRQMLDSGINVRVVWPERMKEGDFSQMKEVVEWCGLTWQDEVEYIMSKLLNK